MNQNTPKCIKFKSKISIPIKTGSQKTFSSAHQQTSNKNRNKLNTMNGEDQKVRKKKLRKMTMLNYLIVNYC